MGSLGWVSSRGTSVLIKRGEHGSAQGEAEECPGHQKLAEVRDLSEKHQRNHGAATTWISDFQPPELGENAFLLF